MAYKSVVSDSKIEVKNDSELTSSNLQPAILYLEKDSGNCQVMLTNHDAGMRWIIKGPVSSEGDALVFECVSD